MTKEELDNRKQDAEELAALVKKIPEEKKQMVFGLLTGVALCAEIEKKKTA